LLNNAPRWPALRRLATAQHPDVRRQRLGARRTALQYRRLTDWLAGTDARYASRSAPAAPSRPFAVFRNSTAGADSHQPPEAQVPNPQTGIGLPLGGLAGLRTTRPSPRCRLKRPIPAAGNRCSASPARH
jgi:hypothetical protein